MNNLNHTDQHDVDEDRMTIADCGTCWDNAGPGAGIALRFMVDPPTFTHVAVASKQKK